MRVQIPTPLQSYTNARQVEAHGATLAELLADLERQFPGFRFRIVNEQDQLREHIKLVINQRIASDLTEPISASDQIRIIMAISGGNGLIDGTFSPWVSQNKP